MRVTLEVDDRDSSTRKAWVQVLQAALLHNREPVALSIGPQAMAPFPSDAKIILRVFPWYTWLVVAGLACFAIALVLLERFR